MKAMGGGAWEVDIPNLPVSWPLLPLAQYPPIICRSKVSSQETTQVAV